MKKKCLSTFVGALAENFLLVKLRILLLKFMTKFVSLKKGSLGFNRGSLVFLVLGMGDGGWLVVFKDSACGRVVKGGGADGVGLGSGSGSGCHEERGIGRVLFGFKEDNGGLSGG